MMFLTFLLASSASALRLGAVRMCAPQEAAPSTPVTRDGLVWSDNYVPGALEDWKGRVVSTQAVAAKAAEAAAPAPRASESKLPGFASSALADLSLNDPTALPQADQDAVLGTAAAGALLVFLLPLVDNFFADLGVSAVVV